MTEIFLHLGSNQGNPLMHILKALDLIEEKINPLSRISMFYKTEAWGKEDQADFINIAVALESKITPSELLTITQAIENQIGRAQVEKWGARNIDIDILYYGQQTITSESLTIPHPHISKRNFVMVPLMEIASDFVDPVQQKTIEELYLSSRDKCEVILL